MSNFISDRHCEEAPDHPHLVDLDGSLQFFLRNQRITGSEKSLYLGAGKYCIRNVGGVLENGSNRQG
jgi:hypothetical protein